MAPVTSPSELTELMRRAQAGDPVALGELLRCLYGYVRKHVAFGRAGDRALRCRALAQLGRGY